MGVPLLLLAITTEADELLKMIDVDADDLQN